MNCQVLNRGCFYFTVTESRNQLWTITSNQIRVFLVYVDIRIHTQYQRSESAILEVPPLICPSPKILVQIYEGGWLEGKRSGTGSLRLPNGDVFEGHWLLDKKEGPGQRVIMEHEVTMTHA